MTVFRPREGLLTNERADSSVPYRRAPNVRAVSARHIASGDWVRFERHMSDIFAAMGLELDTPGTRTTRPELRQEFLAEVHARKLVR